MMVAFHTGQSPALLCAMIALFCAGTVDAQTTQKPDMPPAASAKTMPPMDMPSGASKTNKAVLPGTRASGVPTLSNLSLHKGWPSPVSDNETYGYLLFDPLEYRRDKNADVLRWDIVGWQGGDKQRFWFKSEGSHAFAFNKINQADVQLLYGRLIAPFYDFQIGLRYDQRWGTVRYNSRGFFVVGLQGLAPGRFEVEPALFISQEGNISARFTASYDSQITQRLILQPRFEISAAATELKALGYAAGLNEVEFGLRLRYEIQRNFAPYIGFSWSYTNGSNDNFGRNVNESGWQFSPVAGIRAFF